MIPLVDGNENVVDLHPTLFLRVEALCADPRMEGRLAVESGARTFAEQVYLWNCYQTKKCNNGNLAANPWQFHPGAYDVPHRRGSWHLVQTTGHAYAVDFNYSALPGRIRDVLESVAAEYRLIRTVPSEQWHYQMSWDDWTWTPTPITPDPEPEDEMTPEQSRKLDEVHAMLSDVNHRTHYWWHNGIALGKPAMETIGLAVDLSRKGYEASKRGLQRMIRDLPEQK